MANRDYDLCGWRVTSALPLPELAPWQGDQRAPDIVIDIGAIPDMTGAVTSVPGVRIDAAGSVHYCASGIADYHLSAGRRIVIAPVPGSEPNEVRLFLWSSGLAYLCHQRGVVPIQAAAVMIGDRAVLLCGSGNSGKSTLADAFARRGHRVIGDPVVVFDPATRQILPTLSQLMLWREALDHAGHDPALLVRCRAGLERYWVPIPPERRGASSPPIAAFHISLTERAPTELDFQTLRGAQRIAALQPRLSGWLTLCAMAKQRDAMQRLIGVASAIPHHFVLREPVGFSRCDTTVDHVVATTRRLLGAA